MAPGNVFVDVFADAHHARAFRAVSIRRDSHVVHTNRDFDGARQIGHEDCCPAQQANQDDFLAFCDGIGVVRSNLRAHLVDAACNLALRDEDALDVFMYRRPVHELSVAAS